MTLAEAAGVAEATFWHSVAVFLRVGAAMAVLPAFGSQSVPLRIRAVAAIAFTAVVAPAVPPLFAGPPDLPRLVRFLATETLAGLALGLALRLFVLVLQTAGAIAANAISLAQLLGGAQPEPTPAIGQVLVLAGLAIAVAAGLHVRLAEFLVHSYALLPAGGFPDAAAMAGWGSSQVAKAFALAFSLAAPFLILSLLYNLTLGAISKAMPQLMVAFVGAPVITLGGLALFALAAPLMLTIWHEALLAYLADPRGTP
ncbi:flagellar biosynthetic protein FliR [Rhodosalinus sp. K401]|uniref:flagellar biosynthetic protein FliR n=1 Tax=Rhodosalinus sp. K401 TaxID=3239195 RepID=UPI0035265656